MAYSYAIPTSRFGHVSYRFPAHHAYVAAARSDPILTVRCGLEAEAGQTRTRAGALMSSPHRETARPRTISPSSQRVLVKLASVGENWSMCLF